MRARLKSQGVTGTCIVSLEYLDPAENPRGEGFVDSPAYLYPVGARVCSAICWFRCKRSCIGSSVSISPRSDQLAETDLKSAGRVLDRVGQVDLEGLSTNATALLQEMRSSNAKLDNFIDDTDDTVKKLQLEKLTRDADALVGQLQDTVGKLEPGLTSC